MINAKRKAFLFLSLAFILALFTAFYVLTEISKAQEALGETIRVAVAKQDLRSYSVLTPDKIDWIEVPRSTQQSSYILNASEIEESIVIVNLAKGDLLTNNIVRPVIDIPNNHRIVWLNPTSNVIFDQSVTGGDIVDIIVSYKDGNDHLTKRRFQDVDVVTAEERDSKVLIKVSMDLQDAEELIHFQNTAQQIRVLRVNHISSSSEELPLEEVPDETEALEPLETEDDVEEESDETDS
ncbi:MULTISPECIES: SAF domain-containing protein [Bacillaceae]|uniref:SAF domain-containing protein n=1 Tax=Bacillaceae TaxID=186817 RepID=UPI00047A2939|nr:MULTISPECIES: SAF domain-containing protein [Bacillaceae]UOE92265.1 SAF domain-containing protein [Alkalihalobacillus sp. LMS39]